MRPMLRCGQVSKSLSEVETYDARLRINNPLLNMEDTMELLEVAPLSEWFRNLTMFKYLVLTICTLFLFEGETYQVV